MPAPASRSSPLLPTISTGSPCVPARSAHGCAVTCAASMPVASPCACHLASKLPADCAAGTSRSIRPHGSVSPARLRRHVPDKDAPCGGMTALLLLIHTASPFFHRSGIRRINTKSKTRQGHTFAEPPPPQLRLCRFSVPGRRSCALPSQHRPLFSPLSAFQNASQGRLLPKSIPFS